MMQEGHAHQSCGAAPTSGMMKTLGQFGLAEGRSMDVNAGEGRVLMGEFDDAKLFYVPVRHRYRVELGEFHEEFPATWEPVFGIDVADMQMAEEALDRLLAAAGKA
jgi:hypothetical protein